MYITAGLGRPAGMAGTVIALLSYFLLAAGTYTFLGLAANRLIADELGGPSIPWWVFVAGAWLLSTSLAYRELNLSAKLISVLFVFEFALILGFDATVLFRGGLEGLPLDPFAPANILSGAPGLALLFSAGMFLGFESTAVYRDEAREPEKTIPRATFLTVGFLTVFYAATTYFLIASMGASHTVEIALRDPAKTFPLALGREFGHGAVIAGYVLLCTSLYGAALSMHNVLARYLFRMSENGLIHRRLANIHPRYRAPSAASLTAAVILGLIMAPFPIIRSSPDLLYAKQVGVGSFGFILLLFITSIAVIAYFAGARHQLSAFVATVIPGVAAISIGFIFVLANINFVELVGTGKTTANLILSIVYATGLAGIIWALWVRAKMPAVYRRIGCSD